MQLLAISAAVLTLAPLSAQAASWNVDTSHSSVGFSVRHMMISDVHGSLGGISGTVDFDGHNVLGAKVSISVDVAGINTGDAKRDTHLRSPDFFDVKQFPKATFTSTRVLAGKKGTFQLVGNLTIRGVSKSVTFAFNKPSKIIKDPWGNWRASASGKTTINRKDFGVSWSKLLDNGGLMVSNEVRLTIDLELVTKTNPNS